MHRSLSFDLVSIFVPFLRAYALFLHVTWQGRRHPLCVFFLPRSVHFPSLEQYFDVLLQCCSMQIDGLLLLRLTAAHFLPKQDDLLLAVPRPLPPMLLGLLFLSVLQFSRGAHSFRFLCFGVHWHALLFLLEQLEHVLGLSLEWQWHVHVLWLGQFLGLQCSCASYVATDKQNAFEVLFAL